MASKISNIASNIISELIERYEKSYIGIFQKLQEYENELKKERHRHIFSVENCKEILSKYNISIPLEIRESQIEIIGECLLLLYNWQKCKVIYHLETAKYADIENEYVDAKIYDQFPYPCLYFDYNFQDNENYGVFVTYYKHNEGVYLQKRLLIGYVQRDKQRNVWFIEPIFFDIENGKSITNSIETSMSNYINFNSNHAKYFKKLMNYSCTIVKFISSIIEAYDLDAPHKGQQSRSTNNYFPQENDEYNVKVEIHSKLKLNNKYDTATSIEEPLETVSETTLKKSRKSTRKSPHPRRTHTRDIKVKNKVGEVIGYRTIQISSSYIHKDKIHPLNVKTLE